SKEVQILGLRTTPAVTQVYYQGISRLERAGEDLALKQPLVLHASIGPHVDVANFDPVGVDDASALLHRLQKCLIGLDLFWHHHDVLRRTIETASHLQRHFLIDFGREGFDWLIRRAVGAQEFIANLESRLGGWEPIEDPANEGLIPQVPGENPDAWIGHLSIGKDLSYGAPECACENVEELVVRRVSWRV